MFCKYCGNEVTGKFCTKCGKSTEEPAVQPTPVQSAPVRTEQPTKKKKKNISGAVIAIISVICTLAIVAGGFFGYKALSDKDSGEGKNESSSASENVKDKKKKAGKGEFDISKIENEYLKKMAKAGGLKKHINYSDYAGSAEINSMVDALNNADYKESTSIEDFMKPFGEYAKSEYEVSREEYDEDKAIEFLQNKYNEYGGDYFAYEDDYVIFLDSRIYDYLYNDERSFTIPYIIYDMESDKTYSLEISKNQDDDTPFFTEYLTGTELHRFSARLYDDDFSIAYGFFQSADGSVFSFYDENGDLLVVLVDKTFDPDNDGQDLKWEYYDSELNQISVDEFDKFRDDLAERTGIDYV